MAKMTADEFKKLVYSATKATAKGVTTAAKQTVAQSGGGQGGSSSMSYQPPKPKVILPGVNTAANILAQPIYDFIKAQPAYLPQPMKNSRADINIRAKSGEAVYPQQVSYSNVMKKRDGVKRTPLNSKNVSSSLEKGITSSADSFLDAYEKKLEKDISELKKEKKAPDSYIDKWEDSM